MQAQLPQAPAAGGSGKGNTWGVPGCGRDMPWGLSKCRSLPSLDVAIPARPRDWAHPCCTQGETEAVGGQWGQPAQPRPCTDPRALRKDHPLTFIPSALPTTPSAPRAPCTPPLPSLRLPGAGSGTGRQRDGQAAAAVPPSPRAPRPQEPPLTTKDLAEGSGQRHRRKAELAQGWEGAEHPG